jgi:hypothetical protein
MHRTQRLSSHVCHFMGPARFTESAALAVTIDRYAMLTTSSLEPQVWTSSIMYLLVMSVKSRSLDIMLSQDLAH